MAYKSGLHNAFTKGAKNIDHQHKQAFKEKCEEIQANPSIGETMQGNFKKLDIRKVALKNTNPEFRILYKIYSCHSKNDNTLTCEQDVKHKDIKELKQCNGLVDFLLCGTREMFNNFYKMPLDKLKKYL